MREVDQYPDLDVDQEHEEPEPEDRMSGRSMSVPLIAGVFLLLLGAGGYWMRTRLLAPDAGQTQYKVATASIDTVSKTVAATGTLQPWTTVDIKSKAGGRVNALQVDVGSIVHTGQVLARIDPTDTLLTVQTARAGINGAIAHSRQAAATYQLQVQQSQIAVANAQAALSAAVAARKAAAVQYASARSQAGAQPSITAGAIQQARANYDAAVKTRAGLDATDPQDQAAAQSAYDQAVANQKAATVTLTRQVSLAKKGFVSQQTVDTDQSLSDVDAAQTRTAQEKLRTLQAQQQANVAVADAKVEQARAALGAAQAQAVDISTKEAAAEQAAAGLQQAQAQEAEARAALAQAQANVANDTIRHYDLTYEQSLVSTSQATLSNAATTLAQTVVRAPSNGVVLAKDVSEGTYITSGESLNSTGATIVTIGDVTRMYVQATVDETDLAGVDVGQSVDVSFDAYPNMAFSGKVARIDPQAVVNSNVTQFDVRVEIDNSSPTFRLLKPGMNATCTFIADRKEGVISVPNDAVHTDSQENMTVDVMTGGRPVPAVSGSHVFAEGMIEHRAVQAGLQGDDSTEILSGLKSGEQVVIQTITPTSQSAPASATGSPIGGGGPP